MSTPLGFPIAEISADGSVVITKHEGTGGAVTVDTVTAQLRLRDPGRRSTSAPTSRRASTRMTLTQDGPDRVAITGVRGEAPPATTKVCLNALGGFRNSVEFLLTGLDIPEKAALIRAQMESRARGATRRTRSSGTSTAPTTSTRPRSPRPPRSCAATSRTPTRTGRPRVQRRGDPARARVVPGLQRHRARPAAAPRTASTAPPTCRRPRCRTSSSTPTARAPRSPRRHGDRRSSTPIVSHRLAERRDRRVAGEPVRAPARPARARALRRQGRRRQRRRVDPREPPAPRRGLRLARRPSSTSDGARAAARGRDARRSRSTRCPTWPAVNIVVHGLLGEGVASSTRLDPQAKGARRVAARPRLRHPGGPAPATPEELLA